MVDITQKDKRILYHVDFQHTSSFHKAVFKDNIPPNLPISPTFSPTYTITAVLLNHNETKINA